MSHESPYLDHVLAPSIQGLAMHASLRHSAFQLRKQFCLRAREAQTQKAIHPDLSHEARDELVKKAAEIDSQHDTKTAAVPGLFRYVESERCFQFA